MIEVDKNAIISLVNKGCFDTVCSECPFSNQPFDFCDSMIKNIFNSR